MGRISKIAGELPKLLEEISPKFVESLKKGKKIYIPEQIAKPRRIVKEWKGLTETEKAVSEITPIAGAIPAKDIAGEKLRQQISEQINKIKQERIAGPGAMKTPMLTNKGAGRTPSFLESRWGTTGQGKRSPGKKAYSTLTDEQAAAFKERSDLYKDMKKRGFLKE
jgi:hypothetical protein